MRTQRFFVISDPQIGNDFQERMMKKKTEDVLRTATKDDVVLIPGDLTDHGVGPVDNKFMLYFGYCICFRKKGQVPSRNELDVLHTQHIRPLQEKCRDVLMCIGNHDTYTQFWWGEQAPAKYVKKENGGLIYKKDANGILVFSLSIHPTQKNIAWLDQELAKTDAPFVVFFHYNTKGAYSDWWSDKEKDLLENVLKKYKSRLCFIAEGHKHLSYKTTWRDFPVVNAAGSHAVVVDVTFDPVQNILDRNSRILESK